MWELLQLHGETTPLKQNIVGLRHLCPRIQIGRCPGEPKKPGWLIKLRRSEFFFATVITFLGVATPEERVNKQSHQTQESVDFELSDGILSHASLGGLGCAIYGHELQKAGFPSLDIDVPLASTSQIKSCRPQEKIKKPRCPMKLRRLWFWWKHSTLVSVWVAVLFIYCTVFCAVQQFNVEWGRDAVHDLRITVAWRNHTFQTEHRWVAPSLTTNLVWQVPAEAQEAEMADQATKVWVFFFARVVAFFGVATSCPWMAIVFWTIHLWGDWVAPSMAMNSRKQVSQVLILMYCTTSVH